MTLFPSKTSTTFSTVSVPVLNPVRWYDCYLINLVLRLSHGSLLKSHVQHDTRQKVSKT